MTPSGIEPTTFRFVAQHLNHCATAVIFAVGTNKYQGLVVWWLEHWIIIHRIRIKRFGVHKAPRPLLVPIFCSATIDALNHGD